MAQGRWAQIEELFAQACALPATERSAFLERACGSDAALHAELQSLLHAHDSAAGFLDGLPNPAAVAEPDAPPLVPHARLGTWRIVRPIGRGGMGEVYEVERAEGGFQQKAALKLLKREAAAQIERFHAERRILARLHHPGIAQLLDGGVADDGRPWAVLEYVEGQTITEYCRACGLGLPERLALFLQVCDAVAYAHRNLIVHRDLKPSNILVDEAGRVRLLDFGIAKLLEPGAWGGGGATAFTQIPLTPDYCAPEQISGQAITTATDVHALGLLLYELLTAAKPWSVAGLPLARALRILLETSPPPPSQAAARADAPVPAHRLRGDLDAIVARCLRKEPSHRYASVDALKLDIERSRVGLPIAAREGARLYVLGRFVRRWRWAVTAGAALLLTLTAGLIGVTWQARRAAIEAQRAAAVKNSLLDIFKQNALDNPGGIKARTTTAEQLLDLGVQRIHEHLHELPETQAELLGTIGRLYADLDLSDRAVALLAEQVETLHRLKSVDPGELADAEVQLGIAQVVAGRYLDAERTLSLALKRLDALNDRDSATRAQALEGLAQIAFQTRPADDPAAADFERQALDLLEARYPLDDRRITALIGMARIHARRGEYQAAERRLREALELEERPSFRRMPSDLGSIHAEYGEMLRRARRYQDAQRELSQAIAIYLSQVGPDFPPLLRARQQLALVTFERGRLAEARSQLEEVLKIFERVRGPDDLEWTVDARTSFARVLLARGELETAEREIESAIHTLRAHGPASVYYPIARGVQAELFIARGRWSEAEAAISDARAGIAQFYGPAHQRYAGVLLTEAELRLAQGDAARAEPLYRQLLDPAPWGGDDADRDANARLGLARVRLIQGRIQDAAALAQTVLDGMLTAPGAEPMPDREAAARLWLGQALRRAGKRGAALGHLQRAVELREAIDDTNSPWLAQARLALARCLKERGAADRANELRASALGALMRHGRLGPQFQLAQN
jgi:tetratricopeptide (TPR) repeat protein